MHDRALTLVLLLMFAFTLGGQFATGHREYNSDREDHGEPPVTVSSYAVTGHWWESVFENWESEFL
ncbi:MAG TPA: DUF6766 family protein, partial [Vicinamibacterales bacterium]|nr:DUF6766 family protein [Vicinamibacterales bacterium]